MTDKTPETSKPDWALSGRERKAKIAAAEGRRGPRRRWPWVVLALVALGVGAWALQDRLPLGEASAAEGTTEAPAVAEADTDTDTGTGTGDAPRAVVMQLLPSELTTIDTATLRDTVRITGSLAPVRQLGIPAEVAGRIDSVEKREGQTAAAGEMLVQIDLETLRNQLEQSRDTANATRAQLNFAEEQLSRTQSLVNRGVSSSSTLDSNQANVEQLRANLAALEKQVSTAERSLEKATITAPFDGVVSERMVDPGAYVSPGTPLMTLVDISSLELEAAVPVVYATSIKTGQTVEIIVDGFGSQSFTGTIERVAPVAVSGTRMLPIFAEIVNPEDQLRGGMFASGQLILKQVDDAIGVPRDALRKDDAGPYVLKRDGDRVVRQAITEGPSWDQGRVVQITDGLAAGDVIVSAPLPRLQPDTQITVIGE